MKWKKYGSVIFFATFLITFCLLFLIGKLTGSALRKIPKMILFWWGMISFFIFLFGIGKVFLQWYRSKQFRGPSILRVVFVMAFAILAVVNVGIGMFINVFMYQPEHVVMRDGKRMVATVSSFLQETVNYYEYKSFLFRGVERIGWEDYGNGGEDPIEQQKEPDRSYFKDTDGNEIE